MVSDIFLIFGFLPSKRKGSEGWTGPKKIPKALASPNDTAMAKAIQRTPSKASHTCLQISKISSFENNKIFSLFCPFWYLLQNKKPSESTHFHKFYLCDTKCHLFSSWLPHFLTCLPEAPLKIYSSGLSLSQSVFISQWIITLKKIEIYHLPLCSRGRSFQALLTHRRWWAHIHQREVLCHLEYCGPRLFCNYSTTKRVTWNGFQFDWMKETHELFKAVLQRNWRKKLLFDTWMKSDL